MADFVDVKVGDYAVVQRPYGVRPVVKVEKVTAAQIHASGEWSSRAKTYHRDSVLYAGSEDKAKRLAEQLTSSNALCDNERQKAIERRVKRDADLIASAIENRE